MNPYRLRYANDVGQPAMDGEARWLQKKKCDERSVVTSGVEGESALRKNEGGTREIHSMLIEGGLKQQNC